MSTSRKVKPGPIEENEFTGVAAFLDREDPVDPPTTVDAPRSHQDPQADEITDQSAAPTFATSVAIEGAPTNEAKAPATNATVALRTLWDEPAPRRRRAIPKKAIAAAVFGVLLLVLPLFLRHRSRASDNSAPTLAEDLVVSERDLKNRIEVTADDFHPRRPGDTESSGSPAEAPALTDDESAATLADRRKRRAQDPEDLVGLRGKSSGAHSGSADEVVGGYQRPYVYFEGGLAAAALRAGASGVIAPAGTVVSAILTSPVDLRAGTATIVARSDSDGPIPKTSRFVGAASSDGEGRLELRFDRLLLPDGREAKIQGEAQDEGGTFGLQGSVSTEGGTNGAGTVARELAQDTASDIASEAVSTITGGFGGRLLRRAIGRASSPRGLPSLATRRITLPAGARFQIFLHQAVSVRS